MYAVLTRTLWLALILLLWGCNPPKEIKAGDGFTQSTFFFTVSPNENYPGPTKNIWKNSGLSVKASSKVKLTIEGKIFLCSGTPIGTSSERSKTQTTTIRVDSTMCSGNVPPAYPDAKTNYATYNWASICGGGFSPTLNYINTDVNVSTGDILMFRLIPSTKAITSCGAISDDLAFDNNFLRVSDNKPASASDVCSGTNLKFNGASFTLSSREGESFDSLVTNDPSPLGNKVFSDRSKGIKWLSGSFKDLRVFPSLNNGDPLSPEDFEKIRQKELGKVSCTASAGTEDAKNRDKFESYELNKQCKDASGAKLLTYKMTPSSDVNQPSNEIAQGLIAKIGGGPLQNDGGDLCLPSGKPGQCSEASNPEDGIRLNYPFKIEASSSGGAQISNQPLRFLIAGSNGQYGDNLGGYNVKVERSCIRDDGEDLYLYVGKDPEKVKPGDKGTTLIGLLDGIDSSFEVNGDGGNTPADGDIWFIINNRNPNPNETSGSYKISATVTGIKPSISIALKYILGPFKVMLRGSQDPGAEVNSGLAFTSYQAIVKNKYMKNGIKTLLILYIMFIGIKFLFALGDIKLQELVQIVVKFGFVVTLLSDTSWRFLNKIFLNIFWNGGDDLLRKFCLWYDQFGSGGSQYDATFTFLDKTLGILFSTETIIRLFSLFVSGFFYSPLNLFVFWVMIGAIMDILLAGLTGILLYLTSMVIVAFLIGMAPLFFCFILFKQTFKLFDGWVKQLIVATTAPVFYFVIIGFLNEILFYSMYQVFNFSVNSECLVPLNIGFSICLLWFPIPFAGSSLSGGEQVGGLDSSGMIPLIPVSFMHLIIFMIIAKCYEVIVKVCYILPTALFGGSYMFSSQSIAETASQMKEGLASVVGMDSTSQNRRKQMRQKPEDKTKKADSKGPPDISIGAK